MNKMKRIAIFILCLCLSFSIGIPSALADDLTPASPPIAEGTVNRSTQVYWGKAEYFPIIGTYFTGDVIDIYEYDRDWILTRYETWVTYNGKTVTQEFYGYVKRSDVTCDPELEGDTSPKAETGPGKRKGKKWSPKNPTGTQAPTPSGSPTSTAKPPESTPPVEDMMEYDWIIRTPGVCQTVVNADGFKYVCRFNLMAMKFGGYTPSSEAVYNDGIQNPYVGYVTLTLKNSIAEFVADNNLEHMYGSSGLDVDAYNHNARFYIMTQKDEAISALITINAYAHVVLDPLFYNEYLRAGGEFYNDTIVRPLDIKLVPSGGGYELVVLNMRPGGGDLRFPAMLEKVPLDDITKAERDRLKRERDAERQRKAREEQEKALKRQKEEAERGMDDELSKEGKKGEKTDPGVAPGAPADDDIDLAPLDPSKEDDSEPSLAPLTPESTPEIELAPLTPAPTPEVELAPLVPTPTPEIELAPLVPTPTPEIELAPLTPVTGGGTSEEVEFFPGKD